MSDLEYSVHGHVATLTLNRPDRKNAVSREMSRLWGESLIAAQNDEQVRVIVVTGKGNAFCAGGDLGERKNREQGAAPITPIQRKDMINNNPAKVANIMLDIVDKPVIAAVNGVAAGAGMDAALACDLRFAARSARFTEAWIRVGLVPGNGGCYFLPRLVGPARALDLLLTGDFVGAEEALQIGLVQRVFDDDKLMDETYAYAKRLAAVPPLAARIIKRTVYQAQRMDFRSHMEMVSSHMAVINFTEDSKEALAAFKEKRKPVYKGR